MKLFIICDTEDNHYIVLADTVDHAFEQVSSTVKRSKLMLYDERELDKPGIVETFHVPGT